MSILIFIITMAALITIGVICYQVLMEPDESIFEREEENETEQGAAVESGRDEFLH